MPDPLKRAHSRRVLSLLALMFLAPLGFAFWLYYGTQWRPSGGTNHGELITPLRPLSKVVSDRIFAGKWSLVVIGDGACDAVCQQTLVYARQTWLALGRLESRTQRVWLVTANCCDRGYVEREHPGLRVVDLTSSESVPADLRDALLANFPTVNQARQIFIVDPLGNLMMRYDTQLDPKGLRDDLKKLLDLSRIG
jgi:cytochrome oxidase Cu insertion factor (SCO1/SenC/PrrC family)